MDRQPSRGGQGPGGQRRMEMTANRRGGSFLGDSNILGLSSVKVVRICEYTKNHRTARFKMINFMAYEFYLYKKRLEKKH